MEGSLAAAFGELDNPARRASWCYSVAADGVIYAHYPDEAQTWHAGSARNNDLIGIEHEGSAGEPLTPPQLAASVALVRWLSQAHGFPLVRGVGLLEHNEVSGAPTACPSGRIPWASYTEEEGMTDADRAAFTAILAQLGALGAKVDGLQNLMALSLPMLAEGKTTELAALLKALGG